MSVIDNILNVVSFGRFKPSGVAQTNSFSFDRRDQVLTAPTYREHLVDIFTSRTSQDSRSLLRTLFVQDPDVSSAVFAFLTCADTEPVFVVRDIHGRFDRAGQKELNKILTALTTRFDYTKGFLRKPAIRELSEEMRYMLLLRGGIAEELVFDKQQIPVEIRHVDLATIEWFEVEPNKFVPQQKTPASSNPVKLDIPTFFVSFFRRDPTSIYTHSPFVSSVNTVAARQQVINDLYRIMSQTGFPRIEITVLEEVLLRNAPVEIQQDGQKQRTYIQQELTRIQQTMESIRPDQPFVHTDSVEIKIFNEKNPSNGLDISSVVTALNAMNQAGLRTMATILGRGESGVNTASVEARLFSMHAESLNRPVAEMWSQLMTMALRVVTGTDSHVECSFRPVELRPATELEAQLAIRASRLRQDLSDGIISDDEYHLMMYGRMRPDDAPELSGTGFMSARRITVDETEISPNSDPLGRGLTPTNPGASRGSNITHKDPNEE